MKKLVVVADDFGLCKSVNDGIVRAYQEGIVTEISLMVGSPGTEHAISLIKTHDIKNVGLHLLLKHWREHGDIFRRTDYITLFETSSQADIKALFDKEIAEFEMLLGHKPSHITSQYGIIVNPKVETAAVAYAAKHNIPMRLPVHAMYQDNSSIDPHAQHYMQEHGIRTTHCIFAHTLNDDYEETRDAFLDDLASCDCKTIEFILHPGETSKELDRLSSLTTGRQRDLRLALDPEFKNLVSSQGVEITSYAEAV